MQHAIDHSAATRDDQGRIVLGDPYARGSRCRHCGAGAHKVSENGRLVWYHAPTDCCAGALRDQIQHRRAELEALRSGYAEAAQRIEHLMTEAEEATSRAAEARALQRHARARDSLAERQRSFYEPRGREIKAEIADLERRIAAIEDGHPRPYADR